MKKIDPLEAVRLILDACTITHSKDRTVQERIQDFGGGGSNAGKGGSFT